MAVPSLSTATASARAEQGLLGALGVPRLTVGKHPFIKSQPGLSAVARPETDHRDCHGNPSDSGGVQSLLASQRSVTDTDRHQRSSVGKLPALRSAQKEALREIDEVRTLHHQPLVPSQPRSGFEKLRRKQEERRERDARSIKTFEAGVAAISEEMEQKVLEASYALRDGLEKAEEAVAAVRAELDMDDRLVEGDMTYVEAMWSKLEVQCNRRSTRIHEFQEGLERIETLRSAAVGGELRRLVDDLVAIACRMPDEIERIAEEYAHELNGVLISNRLAHAELLGTMEKQDFAFAVGIRRSWETRRGDWRRLRHNRALVCFRTDLRAPNFTNPPQRVALFREFKEGQTLRHEKRVALLKDLCERRPVDAARARQDGVVDEEQTARPLTTEVVREIREEYATLHGQEIAAILAAQEGLTRIRESKFAESEARREALRAELHSYGAECAEPDLETCCLQVEAVAHDHNLEDFMRKAGGLKHELLGLVQGMRSPEIMYDGCLSMAIEKAELLLCGVDLEGVLDKQGKAGMRRGLADSVERLRKAPKIDIPPILDVMRRQAADLAQVKGIDPLLAACLDRATEDIDLVVETIERRGDSGSGGRGGAPSVGSRVSKRSGMGSSRGKGSRSGGSVSGSSPGGSRGSGGLSRSMTSRGGGWESEIEIDMLQVRAVQRRLGMLACTSDLSEEFKEQLRATRSALEQQRSCNNAVDGVVSQEADGELGARFSEQSQLMERALRSMDARAQSLHACAERLCSFFASLAAELETHEEMESKIDDSGEQRMFECKEDFRLADEDREDAVKTSTDRVRMAADEEELETSFTRVMDLLDQVEASYREYHKTAFTAAKVHPSEVAQEAQRMRTAVCSLVGLRPLTSPTDEGASGDGGGEQASPAEVDGTEGTGATEVDRGEAEGGAEQQQKDGDDPASMALEGEQQQEETAAAASNRHGAGYAYSVAGTTYVVDRTPDEVAQGLLSASNDDEEDGEGGADENETGSATDEENEMREEEEDGRREGQQQEAADGAAAAAAVADSDQKKPGSAGGGKGKGKGKAAAAPSAADVAAAAMANIPRYWRGRFAPLTNDGLQALELEQGQEGLEEYFDRRDRRFIELSGEEVERLRKAAEAEAAARAQAKEEAEKAAKKGAKKGGGKAKKSPAPTPEEVAAAVSEDVFDPPSVLEVYEEFKRDVERHRAYRKEEAARLRAEERMVPRDPTGEAVLQELSMPVAEASVMFSSLRDELVGRMEKKAAAREVAAEIACLEAQEALTEELEERLRKHWPRKGRTEVGSRQPREGELHAHRQKARRFIRQVRDKLSEQERSFREELEKGASARDGFRKALSSMVEGLKDATSVAALQGMESRCKRLVASFEAEQERLQERLERSIKEEPAKLLSSCDDVTRLCRRFAEGGDYDDQELNELEVFLEEPREEISTAAGMRQEALAQAVDDYKLAVDEEKVFKTEHARCVMELSLREGLGQRYGAPRRNAQERLRSVIMRDERCAETIQRLLDDLHGLLQSRKAGDRDGNLAGNVEEKNPGPVWGGGSRAAGRRGGRREGESELASTSSAHMPPDDNRSLTQLLRSNLLSLRAAFFRHASFLEFLPAPERVDKDRVVPGGDLEDVASGVPEDQEEGDEGVGEVLDPEVTLMPQEGETFAGSLDSLETRCRSETRLLYESEGKEDLLGDSGVPESLRVWLEESRGRALGEGGHRERARRILREQVERFEFLVAKRPVPRDISVGPRAPALMLFDLSSRLEQAASADRRKREANFERTLSVWAAARTRHQRLLRPAFGSADRRDELNELLALEASRAAEASAAIVSFSREMLQQEEAVARDHAAKMAKCFGGVTAILDSVVMVDDLGKLPGDDDLEPKRRGLRRLRKAERAFLKQQEEQGSAIAGRPGGSRKRSTAATAAGAKADDVGQPKSTDARGKGRQWDRRCWRTRDLHRLARVVLAARTIVAAEAPAAGAAAGDTSALKFSAVLDGLDADAAKATEPVAEDRKSATEVAMTGGSSGGNKGGKGGKKAKGGGKGKEAASSAVADGQEENDAAEIARRRKEEREDEVRVWTEGLREALEGETFVTTAHRVAVAARDAIVLELADKTKNTMIEIQERYGRLLEAEAHWGTKWKQLVDLLVSNEAS
eukprot:g13894.t1